MSTTRESYRSQIADMLASLGLTAAERQLEADEENPEEFLWLMRHGSATILVRLLWNAETDTGWFRVSAPLVFLPEKHLLAFYRRLLELNAELPGVGLAAVGPAIELLAERPVEGMEKEEAQDLLQRVATCADRLDDMLFEGFGAPPWRPE